MRANLYRLAVLGAALLLVLPVRAQDSPKDTPKDDPLPKGAKVRLAGVQPRFRSASAFTLLPPDYKTFLVNEGQGVRWYDLVTGRDLGTVVVKGVVRNQLLASGDGKRVVI